jgi:hypothetical protein
MSLSFNDMYAVCAETTRATADSTDIASGSGIVSWLGAKGAVVVALYDAATVTGTPVRTIEVSASQPSHFENYVPPIRCGTGITVEVTGTGEFTIGYKSHVAS